MLVPYPCRLAIRRHHQALWLLLLPALLLAGCSDALPTRSVAARAPRAIDSAPHTARDSQTRPFVYVAIGASDTFGYGVPNPAQQGWVPRFAATLPTGTRVVNLGVVGIALHRALAVDLPVALDAKPDLVTIWLAVNDLTAGVPLTSYRADLYTLLNRLHSGTHARILVGNLPDLSLVPAVADRLGPDAQQTLASWNAVIADVTADNGATLVDLYSSWQQLAQHPEYVGADGLHPSVAGYARLAQIFAAAR